MAERITPEVVERLTAVARAATPGPWIRDDENGGCDIWQGMTPSGNGKPGRFITSPVGDDAQVEFDATHIAAFDPPTCLALLEALAAERARVAVLEGALRTALTSVEQVRGRLRNRDLPLKDAPGALTAIGAGIHFALAQAQEPRDA